MLGDDFVQDALDLLHVVRVGHPEGEIDPADLLGRHVADHVAPDLAVGHDQGLVVEGEDRGGDQAHRAHAARHAGGLDHVAHVEGPVDQDHRARGEVREGVLQREADDEAGDAEAGQQRPDLHAELGERHQHADHHDQARRPADHRVA